MQPVDIISRPRRKPPVERLLWLGRLLIIAVCWAVPAVHAAGVDVRVEGVDDELLDNVDASLTIRGYESDETLSERQIERLSEQAVAEAATALRPFGYYNANVQYVLTPPGGGNGDWKVLLDIAPGPPVRVREVNVQVTGPGADLRAFTRWRSNYPLTEGDVLRQAQWSEAKRSLELLADTHGFFGADFESEELLIDVAGNHADLNLVMATGPRYEFGETRFDQSTFEPELVDRFDQIRPGTPYHSDRIEELREDLTTSGYFQSVELAERRDTQTHRVDLEITLSARKKNTYQTTLGFGTDTGARLAFDWTRHFLTDKGDSFTAGVGIQQENTEYILRGEYRRPRGSTAGEFLIAGASLQREDDEFSFFRDAADEPVFPGLEGLREQARVRFGRLVERDWFDAREPVNETIFLAVSNERFDALPPLDAIPEERRLIDANPQLEPFLNTRRQNLALGLEYDWLQQDGAGFDNEGFHLKARLLGSSDTLGSDTSFAQLYTSARFIWRLGDHWKLLTRGEFGYTEAPVSRFSVSLDGEQLDLSLTQLPELYRFDAGGDRSVRGYGFERLSNNRNGSNHLVTASVEVEYQILEEWSVAAFADTGNAFNDFSDVDLKQSVGLGLRYYSIVGPIRLDRAHPMDADESIRIHFTLGSPLL